MCHIQVFFSFLSYYFKLVPFLKKKLSFLSYYYGSVIYIEVLNGKPFKIVLFFSGLFGLSRVLISSSAFTHTNTHIPQSFFLGIFFPFTTSNVTKLAHTLIHKEKKTLKKTGQNMGINKDSFGFCNSNCMGNCCSF